MQAHVVCVLGLAEGEVRVEIQPWWAPFAWHKGAICQEAAFAWRGQPFQVVTKAQCWFAVGGNGWALQGASVAAPDLLWNPE